MVDLGWMLAQGAGVVARRIGERHGTDPTEPFAVGGLLGWLGDVAHQIPMVSDEVLDLLDRCAEVPSTTELSSLSVGVEGAWRLLPLVHRRRDPKVLDLLPITAELLRGIPHLRAADVAVLDGGSRIAPHRGDNWGVVRVHLTLREPPGDERCALRFPELGREQAWKQGGVFGFEDLALHEAVNDRHSDRVVLLIEVDRPLPWVSAAVNGIAQRAYAAHPVQRAVRFDAVSALVAHLHVERPFEGRSTDDPVIEERKGGVRHA